MMNTRRDYRNRNSLFDSLEEGGLRPASSYSTSEIAEQENDRGIDDLSDRVNVLKRLTSDIHGEVDTHNRLLERMEQDMDSSRGMLSGTMDRFTRVFETKSGRNVVTIVGSLVIVFLLVYYLTK
ncbi:blocked early in transport 1 [Marchantia polymorpha subsp. ruderalis]|uniref:t-SNARE coiled-coil homology domain-containing protein n=2 Tax=Marchantia polymorpha TaxID=3197 RepID=A0AAF6AUY9_MARPO|nr:hypothetical protein MARPO_0002s0103 [Marchantia polymorpha]BAS01246.1 blocked early in transport 1 [Marchantia polymorpha]BBN00260.1 hypothetical protein Mp_1g27750 [Marchantia polymorpha subsp. ruderalis]|eukprot:PTQ49623.1 hypothetical protein MARPO_0002s0103 [Marchantia polymorpha]